MKPLQVICALALATTLAGTAWSQNANVGSGPQIFGFVNPATNTFQPMYAQTIGSPATVSVATGKIVTTFTITVTSAIGTTVPILCNVTADVPDVNTTTFVTSNNAVEQAAVVASRATSTTAKCTVSIPYSWKLSNRTTDKVQLTYSIDAITTSSTAGVLVQRLSSQTIATIPVPANGVTTTETVTATI